MSRHLASVEWQRGEGEPFVDNRYSRAHRWRFDGGIELPASASTQVVPPPFARDDAVDPEEAFVASLASCHLLWFLSIAAAEGLVVERYVDAAEGRMARDADGRLAIVEVVLRPHVRFAGTPPGETRHRELHERAHDECFIARSVKTDVRCEPTLDL